VAVLRDVSMKILDHSVAARLVLISSRLVRDYLKLLFLFYICSQVSAAVTGTGGGCRDVLLR
jgi:hypothetical protein